MTARKTFLRLPLAKRTNVRYNITITRERESYERTHLHLHRSEVFLRVGGVRGEGAGSAEGEAGGG